MTRTGVYRWRMRRVHGPQWPISTAPLSDAMMQHAIERSEREGWKDITP